MRRAQELREFVAWDGEGVTIGEQGGDLMRSEYERATRALAYALGEAGEAARSGALRMARQLLPYAPATPAPHRYVLMMNSRGAQLENENGIPSIDALDFLLDGASAHPKASHVVYGGSYDAVKILGDLPRGGKRGQPIGLADILGNKTRFPVRVSLGNRLYSIDYRPRKYLAVARFRSASRKFSYDPITRKHRPDYDAKIRLWDVIGFYQAAFVEALKEYQIEADLERIAGMKAKRSGFDWATERELITRYCGEECEALERLMERLWSYFVYAKIRPARLDGAGAVAAALMQKMGVKESIALEPQELRGPAARAFFGGRIELMGLGVPPALHGIDISSAYPAAATELPSMVGRWVRTTSLDGFTLAHVRYRFPMGLRWYPLPYRSPQGTIAFASEGEGYHWAPEARAALAFAAQLGGEIELIEAWRLEPVMPELRPFAFIPPLYRQRQEWKDAGIGAERAVKTALNSLYGKSAQQIGATIIDERVTKLPPYLCLPWAGWITATTRARLIEAALLDPEAIIAFATDGIYTSRELPLSLTHKAELGAWEPAFGKGEQKTTRADGAVFVQAGVYWTQHGEAWKARYRGFDKDLMTSPKLALDAWSRGEWGVDIPTTRFVTFGSALASRDLWDWRGTWRTAPRRLDLTGASPKRYGAARSARPDLGYVPLAVRRNEWYAASGEPSAAYDAITLREQITDGVPTHIHDEEVAGY